MAGIGKRTLVKKFYDSEIVRKWCHYQSQVIVSKSFTLLELLYKICLKDSWMKQNVWFTRKYSLWVNPC